MKLFRFFLIGIWFGIVMTKSQAISWFRIQEMFRFESFHMYGIITTAVIIGAIGVQVIKRLNLKTFNDEDILINSKKKGLTRYLAGGIIFGLGWSLVGACPGPMFVLIGQGLWSILIVIGGALMGTFLYGLIRDHLPH